jgi:hypothetical protein
VEFDLISQLAANGGLVELTSDPDESRLYATASGYEILIPLFTVGHQKDPGMPKSSETHRPFRRPPDVT